MSKVWQASNNPLRPVDVLTAAFMAAKATPVSGPSSGSKRADQGSRVPPKSTLVLPAQAAHGPAWPEGSV